jgi:hypothetical protein
VPLHHPLLPPPSKERKQERKKNSLGKRNSEAEKVGWKGEEEEKKRSAAKAHGDTQASLRKGVNGSD